MSLSHFCLNMAGIFVFKIMILGDWFKLSRLLNHGIEFFYYNGQ